MGVSTETQEKIIASALKLFAEQGYHGTTTSQIARECGVSEGTVFKYYRTKKFLLESVLQKIIHDILPGIAFDLRPDFSSFNNPDEGRQYLKSLLTDKVLRMKSNFNALRVLVTELQYHPDLKKTYADKLIPGIFQMIEGFLEKGIEKGVFRNIDVHIVARCFMGAMATMLLENTVLKKDINFDKNLDVIFDLFFNGLDRTKDGSGNKEGCGE